jgi:hypothetical protein
MKYLYLKSLNIRLIVSSLIFVGIAFIINSCKKDNSKAQSTITSAAVSQAKAWYENTYPVNANGGKLTTQGVNSNYDYSQVTKPDWNHAATYTRLGKNVIEMPIDPSSSPIYSALSSGGSTGIYPKENSRSSFILLSDGKKYSAFIMTIMADPSYLKGDLSKLAKNTYRKRDSTFTGFVFYFTPKGQYSGGYEFKNGQLLTPAAPGTQSNGKTIQSVGTSYLKTAELDPPTVTCTFYWDLTIDGYGNIVSQVLIYYVCDTSAPPSGGSDGSTGTGSPGGAAPPVPPTCTPSSGGSSDDAVRNIIINVAQPLPPGGDGGMPPPTTEPCSVTEPVVVDTTKTPCSQVGHVDSVAQNSTIAAQNTQILAKTDSSQKEYGANQNLKSLTGSTYVNTAVGTNASTDSFIPVLTWDATNGFTVGWSHGHPGGSAPSPDDVLVMPDKLSNTTLQAAGASAIQFYKNKVSVGVVTSTVSFIVTVSNWSTIQTLLTTFKASPVDPTTGLNAFDENYAKIGGDYKTANPLASDSEAGAYALMTVFGDSINIYEAPKGSTTYTPLTLTTDANGNKKVANLQCPQL